MSRQQSGPQGSEKRSAFRCRVPASRWESVLRVGRRQIPVRVLDESAGGFAVLVGRRPRVAPDDVVRLCTDSGWHEVRVVHVDEHRPASSDSDGDGARGELLFRVGLKRLRDVPPWETDRGVRAWFDRLRIGSFLSVKSGSVVVPLMFLSALIAGLTMGAIALRNSCRAVGMSGEAVTLAANSSSHAISRSPQQPGNSPQPAKPSQGPSAKARSDSRSDSSADPPAGAIGSDPHIEQSSPGSPLAEGGDLPRLAATIGRLPGASPFASKEVVQALSLSGSQQKQIWKIIELSSEAVRQIHLRFPGQTRQQHAEKRQILLDEARRRVLELLTEEQRARWEALQSSSGD